MKEVNIAIIGKYVENVDSYISVIESLKHAAINNQIKLNYFLINAKKDFNDNELLKYDGILVPGGFGEKGIEGKMKAIKYARENNIPFLGICFGMQLAILEFAQNVLKLDVVHGEIDKDSKNKIIDIMKETKGKVIGGTMRLGNYDCEIRENTLAHKIYDSKLIKERHRHRYEFNNKYQKDIEDGGLIVSGIHPETKLVEIVENKNNDFFVAVQFHPEISSKVTNPNKLILNFILESQKKNASLKS